MKKWAKALIDISPNKMYKWLISTKECSTLLVIREMQKNHEIQLPFH